MTSDLVRRRASDLPAPFEAEVLALVLAGKRYPGPRDAFRSRGARRGRCAERIWTQALSRLEAKGYVEHSFSFPSGWSPTAKARAWLEVRRCAGTLTPHRGRPGSPSFRHGLPLPKELV